MRRLLLVVALCLLVVPLAAQERRYRARWATATTIPTAPAPSVAIDTPSSSGTYSTSTSEITVGGSATDADGTITQVMVTCATCTPTSQTDTTIVNDRWEVTFTAQTAGANTLSAVATDNGANTSAAAVLVSTYTAADVGNPTVTITTNCGSGAGVNCTVSASTTELDLAGTCTDTVSSGDALTVVSATSDCEGTDAWSCPAHGLSIGTNILQVTCTDEAGNQHTDSITVTRPTALTWSTNADLGNVRTTSTTTRQLTAVGGTGSITYAEVVDGGDVLGAGDCADITLATSGLLTISTPPAQPVTCSFTVRATDGAAATADREFSIDVDDSVNGNTFFEELCERSDVYELNGTPICLGFRSQDEIDDYSDRTPNTDITYDAAMDAAKATTPEWGAVLGTLNGTLSDSANSLVVTGLTDAEASAIGSQSVLLVESEIMLVTRNQTSCPVTTTLITCVTRGQFGTTATSHASGVSFKRNQNNLGNNVRVPLRTDGSVEARYLLVWDSMLGLSYFTSTGSQDKWFQITSHIGDNQAGTAAKGRIWFEPQIERKTNNIDILECEAFDPALHVGCVSLRTYNKTGGTSNWIDSSDEGLALTTLTNAINDSQLTAVFGRTLNATVLVKVDSEILRIAATCTAGSTCTIERGVNSTTPAAHLAAAAVTKIDGWDMCTDVSCTNPVYPDAQPVRAASGTSGALAVAPDQWIRFYVLADIKVDDYDLMSMWACAEDADCVQIHHALPLSALMGGQAPNSLRAWWAEFNTSSNRYEHQEDWVAWFRNFVVLENPADCTAADCSALLARPIR